jgi:hypothetical protein
MIEIALSPPFLSLLQLKEGSVVLENERLKVIPQVSTEEDFSVTTNEGTRNVENPVVNPDSEPDKSSTPAPSEQ